MTIAWIGFAFLFGLLLGVFGWIFVDQAKDHALPDSLIASPGWSYVLFPWLKAKRDYVDWEKIDTRARFVACDEDGETVEGFSAKPEIVECPDGVGYWHPPVLGTYWEPIPYDAIIGPRPHWRESLRRRPS